MYFLAGLGMNMSILVTSINRCGKKDLSLEVRHKSIVCQESTTAING